ncbi:MAG TPA: hypothetical protein VHO70_09900 [Chitinispirillaceae bacterium]|nr:hypothetical protein [Chitinispirillaceae bacterium]
MEKIIKCYPLVEIINSTSYQASGTVGYMSGFCSKDEYTVTPNTTWKASSRGACLLTKISAVLNTPSGFIQATPYTSSGTSYSHFAIIQTGANSFEVTRRVTATKDEIPADYVEPTEKQK